MTGTEAMCVVVVMGVVIFVNIIIFNENFFLSVLVYVTHRTIS